MTDFKEIVKLRNQGKSQEDIANLLGLSRRTIIRYLQSGKIPKYNRTNKSNRQDPMADFMVLAMEKIKLNPKISLNELLIFLQEKGYQGSDRTLRRKTKEFRDKMRKKEVFFQREATPGEVMEGDFTEFNLLIGNVLKKVYLWVTSLPYSNTYFAVPYYNCSFESFSDGSVKAFEEFGGVATKYRLDNMSPVVTKVLQGKDRLITARYAEFQNHYGFKQDFCNPGKGNEKGNVESNNKTVKRRILDRISLYDLSFSSIDAFEAFVTKVCREHNAREKVKKKLQEEELASLPERKFECFRTCVVSINKYSLFSLEKSGHMYSVPSDNIGLSLEVRVFPRKIEVYRVGELLASHKRLHGPRGLVSIKLEHIIKALIKKPGAMKDWKHRDLLFERPAWKRFYTHLKEKGGTDKEYLKCLNLILNHGREKVTLAMELAAEDKSKIDSKYLESIITNEMENVLSVEPIDVDLLIYDQFLKGDVNGSKLEGCT